LRVIRERRFDRIETAPDSRKGAFRRSADFAQGDTMRGDANWQSVSWPLKVIFVTTFLTGVIGLLSLRIGNWTETISWILLGISIAMAIMLLFPTFADLARKGAISAGLNAICQRLDRIEIRLGALATSAEVKAVANQLESTGLICTTLVGIKKKVDADPNDIGKQLERLANLLDERTTRLKAIKGQLGSDGDLERGLKTISDAQGDPPKMKAAVDSLQQAVDKLRENMSTIN
jgi:hypothetical protein